MFFCSRVNVKLTQMQFLNSQQRFLSTVPKQVWKKNYIFFTNSLWERRGGNTGYILTQVPCLLKKKPCYILLLLKHASEFDPFLYNLIWNCLILSNFFKQFLNLVFYVRKYKLPVQWETINNCDKFIGEK